MAIKEIEPDRWSSYFDEFSRSFLKNKRTDYAEIKVMSEEMGVQKELGWLPLKGITYDKHDDVLDVSVDKLDHLIFHPEHINVDEDEIGFLVSVEIREADGTREIIELR